MCRRGTDSLLIFPAPWKVWALLRLGAGVVFAICPDGESEAQRGEVTCPRAFIPRTQALSLSPRWQGKFGRLGGAEGEW